MSKALINCSKSGTYLIVLMALSLSSFCFGQIDELQHNYFVQEDPISQLATHIGLTHQIGENDLVPFEIFDLSGAHNPANRKLDSKSFLSFDEEIFKQLSSISPESFSLSFAGHENEIFEIAFEKTNLLSEDYVLRTCQDVRPSKLISTYQSNNKDYKANCLVYENHIYVNVYTPQEVFRLNNRNKNQEYFLYIDRTAIENDILCGTDDIKHAINEKPESTDQSIDRAKDAIQIYFEIDYAKFLDHNSDVLATEEHLISLFADVSTFFSDQSVDMEISEIMVWTNTDPYAQYTSLPYVLDKFGEQLYNGFNGDLAHLISGRNIGGGLAWIGGLCQGIEIYTEDWDGDGIEEDHYSGAHSVSGNHTTDLVDFPEYSWNVEVITHELGHTMGSPHTHACAWGPNGDEPIDNCWSTEGSCDSGPPPLDGGTIMSFCHLSYQGINFLNGFGEEPGDLIYNAFANASCISGEEEPGEICNQAIPLPENGMLGCDGPTTGFGAHHSDAVHSRWYVFEPTTDVMVSFNSCGSSANTRLWIYEGSCQDLLMLASNDDSCASGSSKLEDLTLSANKSYFIEWDNKWSSEPFDFEIASIEEIDCITELPSPLVDGTYHVDGEVNIDNPAPVNEELMIKSTESVELGIGFEMNHSYNFEILIEDCSTSGS